MIDDGSPDTGMSSTDDRGEAPAGVPFDAAACLAGLIEETATAIRRLRRRGAVVAVSGGVDSGVVAGICVRAVGPEHVLCLRLPERDIGDSSSDLGSRAGSRTWREDGGGADHRRARGVGLLPPPRRGDSARVPGLRIGLASQAGSIPSLRRDHLLLARRRASGRQRGGAADASRGVSGADIRHEHEAARAQGPRVHLGRPPRLRGDRHSESARVRPGVLRQGR